MLVADDDRALDTATHPVGDRALVMLATLPPLEAEMARAKLAAEDIPAVVIGSTLNAAHPLLWADAELQVHASDVDRARQILARPAAAAKEWDYADEPWRCPKCHHKPLELVPLSRLRRSIRNTWIVVVALPVLIPLIDYILYPAGGRGFELDKPAYVLGWIVAVVLLTILIFYPKRSKQCKECGWRQHAKAGESD